MVEQVFTLQPREDPLPEQKNGLKELWPVDSLCSSRFSQRTAPHGKPVPEEGYSCWLQQSSDPFVSQFNSLVSTNTIFQLFSSVWGMVGDVNEL